MYFTKQRIKRICDDLQKLIYHLPWQPEQIYWTPGRFTSRTQAAAAGLLVFGPEDRWGSYDGHAWFQTDITLPAQFEGVKIVLDVSVDLENWFPDSRQFMLYLDGAISQGMDINHRKAVLRDQAKAGEKIKIDLAAYAGLIDKKTELYLQVFAEDSRVKKLYYDILVPWQVAAELAEQSKLQLDILDLLNSTINLIDLRQPYSPAFYESLAVADKYLEEEFYQAMCRDDKIKAVAVGHTHIDVAWLWRLDQTREKTGRSFSTVLRLMEDYPEYKFMSSQPQLYQFLEEDYPELFAKVEEKIQQGSWEAEGAMWLEADCNLASGEALVRQVLFGTSYFKEKFGVTNKILWLPDVFGYSAALPQILKLCGIDYFMTTKINWNQYNPIPADSFNWVGLDGSSVLTHFITTTSEDYNPTPHFSTYNGVLAPRPVMGGWQRYQEKQIHNEILVAYGYGDGGGGPTEEMLETGRRMARGIPGCPQVAMEHSLPFFERLEKAVQKSPWLKKWVGELYFEYHRGTYTSMGNIKRFNRKAELLYHDVESLASLAGQRTAAAYPAAGLKENWQLILLNQFHDILPGSSIKPVYDDALLQYEQVFAAGRAMLGQSIKAICQNIETEQAALVVFNTAGFERSDLAVLPWPEEKPLPQLTRPGQDLALPVQRSGGQLLFLAQPVPAKGYCSINIQENSQPDLIEMAGLASLEARPDLLENRFFRIELDEQGHFCRIYDKSSQREVLPAGSKANVLRAFEDKPMQHQNWDIDIYYSQKSFAIDELESITVVETGPVRAGLLLRRRFLSSTVNQLIYIYDQLPRIDFVTQIDWQEDELLVKAEFPVEIHAQTATYDIQFGNVTRPTHWNTSWDWARFEVCAHKWADLSEDGYGVSLLNDCKYGHDIRDGVMRLTLLKSGTAPNPEADRGEHQLVYSLYPHAGDWRQAGTMQQAYSLNLPLYTHLISQAQPGRLAADWSLVNVDAFDHVMIETVKQAEDGTGLIIRIFEYSNWRGRINLTFGCPLVKVSRCNLLEETVEELKIELDPQVVTLPIKPYEIVTLKVELTDH